MSVKENQRRRNPDLGHVETEVKRMKGEGK